MNPKLSKKLKKIGIVTMPTKPKYNYDIKKIAALESKGLSIREIARIEGWPEGGTHQWIKRNYDRVVTYLNKGVSDE